jgi:hypothetical protein
MSLKTRVDANPSTAAAAASGSLQMRMWVCVRAESPHQCRVVDGKNELVTCSDRGDFWTWAVEILVFAKSNRSHVDILRFSFIKLEYILWIPLKWSVIFLQSWISTNYFSNSTSSFVTNCRFSPIISHMVIIMNVLCEFGVPIIRRRSSLVFP